MKVSTEIDNNFGYEKITQLVDNIPLRGVMISLIDLAPPHLCISPNLVPWYPNLFSWPCLWFIDLRWKVRLNHGHSNYAITFFFILIQCRNTVSQSWVNIYVKWIVLWWRVLLQLTLKKWCLSSLSSWRWKQVLEICVEQYT